ncbi:type II toxin-antitoxin system ParD family antitoxin [Pseudomonas sp. R2.Fl]|nr:type II toxin-antitoxin system ParD family antitoxin [Pseudomonas sp. R2.Fl]
MTLSNVEKISVSLTPQHADLLRDAVNSGAYASGSEVIREALRDWSAKWLERRDDLARLQVLWAEGKASGEAGEVDFDAVLDEARKELQAARRHGR